MTTKLESLRGAALKAVEDAKSIAAKADAESRDMTDTEQHDYTSFMAKASDFLEQIKVAKADQQIMDAAKSLALEIGETAADDVDAQTQISEKGRKFAALGRQVVESAQYKSLLSANGGRFSEKARIQTDPISVKGLVTGASSTSGGAFIVPDQSGIVEMLGRRPLTLRDLVSVRSTGSDAVEFVRQTTQADAAAPVAEATTAAAPTVESTYDAGPPVEVTSTVVQAAGGGYKPEANIAFERVTTNVKTIAVWIPATKRALADVAQLEGLINDELTADIAQEEEDQLLNGDGTGENFTGILETSGIQTQSFATDIFTTLRKALTKARNVGRVIPNAVLMNPANVETLDLARENGSTGGFLAGGPFGSFQRTIWGVPIVETSAIAENTALIGDFSRAVIWDREETTISITDSHADFFIRNLVAILAEERLAFGVTRPKAFVEATVSA